MCNSTSHPRGFTHTHSPTHSLTHSLTSRTQHSAQCDTFRVQLCLSNKLCQVRVGFCGLSSVRPPSSDVTPATRSRLPDFFSQDGGFWDSLEYGFVTEREGQITSDKFLAFSDLEAIWISLSCILFFFSPPGRAGNPTVLHSQHTLALTASQSFAYWSDHSHCTLDF